MPNSKYKKTQSAVDAEIESAGYDSSSYKTLLSSYNTIMNTYISQFGGKVGNIPRNHDYWNVIAKYQWVKRNLGN